MWLYACVHACVRACVHIHTRNFAGMHHARARTCVQIRADAHVHTCSMLVGVLCKLFFNDATNLSTSEVMIDFCAHGTKPFARAGFRLFASAIQMQARTCASAITVKSDKQCEGRVGSLSWEVESI